MIIKAGFRNETGGVEYRTLDITPTGDNMMGSIWHQVQDIAAGVTREAQAAGIKKSLAAHSIKVIG
jgi:hypothetical protein